MSDVTVFHPDEEDGFGRAREFDAERPDTTPKIGQWYWVIDSVNWDGEWKDEEVDEQTGKIVQKSLKKGDKVEWLACVMKVGSNFVALESPRYDNSSRTTRIHLNDVEKELRFEPDADKIISDNIALYQQRVNTLLGDIQEVTKRLGVVPHTEITDKSDGSDNALAVISSQPDTSAYKNALIKAKEDDLPVLFKAVEEAHKHLAKWMVAPTMPTRALMGPMKNGIKLIDDRIYTIELYAGHTEDAVKISDGDPAATHEPLRVMQRRLYMDEECLLDYTAGGMEYKDISQFDEWLARPHNRDRLLPFQRSVAAFRVRRDHKEREDGGSIAAFINIQLLKDADKTTFLYVRNGEQVWRVNCDFVFDEMIFPNREDFDPTGEMMVRNFTSRADKKMMPKQRYISLCILYEKHLKWMKEFDGKPVPGSEKQHYYSGMSPYRRELGDFQPSAWQPFDETNLYFDEAVAELQEEMRRYNRIAVIIQGLFDRSLVLHPHPPVRVWDAESFARSVELVYDSQTLTYGDKPDFEAYRAKLNASIGPDTIVTGQEDYWMRVEAERENERQRKDYRERSRRSHYKRYRPYENPGPGLVSKMTEWKPRARKAHFRWEMPKQHWSAAHWETKSKILDVPVDNLFNVTDYKPGDYKQFFQDPRTRMEYIQWAPLMLAAEDYHAGKVELGKSGGRGNSWDSY